MTLTLAILLFAVGLVITYLRPIAGIGLAWLAIWLYPNRLFYGLLPLNVRLDDLFMVAVTLICVLRSRGKMGWGVGLALVWFAMYVLGNISGMMVTGGVGWNIIVKSIGKASYVPMTAIAISSQVVTRDDVKRLLKWTLFAGCCTAALGLLTVYAPATARPFIIYQEMVGRDVTVLIEQGEEIGRRARGSIGIMAMAGVQLSLAVLSLALYAHESRPRHRLALLGVLGFLAVGLLHTQTRGAIGAFAVVLLLGIVFTRRRKPLIAALVLGTVGMLTFGGMWERMTRRFMGSGSVEGSFMSGLFGRFDVWSTIAGHWSPVYFITGMGMTTMRFLFQATAHSAYIGAMVYGGTFGIVVLLMCIFMPLHLSKTLRLVARDDLSLGVSLAMKMMIVAFMVSGLVIENFQAFHWMQVLIAVYVLGEKLRDFAVQSAPQWSLAYAPGGGWAWYARGRGAIPVQRWNA
jgi:hypothetical protein